MKIRFFTYHIKKILRTCYSRLLCPQHCLLCGAVSELGLPLCRQCSVTKFQPYLYAASSTAPACTAPLSTAWHAAHSAPALSLSVPAYASKVSPIAEERCNRCGKILISEHNYCTHCKTAGVTTEDTIPAKDRERTKTACDRIFTLFPYIGLGQKLLPLWKNHNIRTFSTVFAPLIALFLAQHPELTDIPLVPVPPRRKKLREKGWDQIEDLATDLSIYPHLTICRCLKRQDGIAQKQLSKLQRARNLKGKIHLSVRIIPDKLIVLDDVRTTGATLDECARVLKAHGCKEVYGLCLFFD